HVDGIPDEALHGIKCLGMVRDLQMFSERVTINGHTVFKDHFCLSQSQRIAFDSVGMVRGLDPEILVQSPDNCRIERSVLIKLLLFLTNSSGESSIHTHWISHALLPSTQTQT